MADDDNEVRIEEVVSAEKNDKKLDESLAEMMVLDKINEEAAKTRRLMKYLAGICLLLGSVLLFSTFVICNATWRHSAELAVALCVFFGIFSISAGVSIIRVHRLNYSIKELNIHRLHYIKELNVKVVAPSLPPIRIRSNSEISETSPKAFLVASAAILLACSACMIVGDVRINFELPYIKGYSIGSKLVHAAFSSVFIIGAFVNLALALPGLKSKNKTLASCAVALNVAGAGMAFALILVNQNVNIRTQKDFVNPDDLLPGLRYPLQPLGYLLVMKFFPAVILFAFCVANALAAVGMVVAVNEDDIKDKSKTQNSKFLGLVGVACIVLGIVLQIVFTMLPLTIRFSQYYQVNDFSVAGICVCTAFLITGLQAFFGFYSAKTLRRFTLLLLGLALFGTSIFALVTVNDNQQRYSMRESEALSPSCRPPNMENEDVFCVFNATSNDGIGMYRAAEQIPMACIPRQKYCDGKVDLIGHDYDEEYNSWNSRSARHDFYLCGTSHDRTTFPDEEFCYADGMASVLFMTGLSICGVGVLVAVLIILVTLSSLPEVIKVVFNCCAKIFVPMAAENGGEGDAPTDNIAKDEEQPLKA